MEQGPWIAKACDVLLRAGRVDGGWGYRLGGAPAVEPTVLTCLALAASDGNPPDRNRQLTTRGACGWLAGFQEPGGSVGITREINLFPWATPYALFLWALHEGFEAQRKLAVQYLVQAKGLAFPKDDSGIIGHNPELIGWPWVPNTHSWLEPTAIAMLALQREGLGDHRRVKEATTLVIDRAIPSGGWNYGNKSAFGHTLRPQPAPTGMALLAIHSTSPPKEIVEGAATYLEKSLPQTRAPRSLSWGLLGLTAFGRRPRESETWLQEAYRDAIDRRDPPYLLAPLVLAGVGKRALSLLGVTAQKEVQKDV